MSGLIEPGVLQAAKTRSPVPIWQLLGYQVVPAGSRELRVMEGQHTLYRSVRQDDGTWVSCMAAAGLSIAPHVGDNISLLRHFCGLSFRDAVRRLENIPDDIPSAKTSPARSHPDTITPTPRRSFPYEPPATRSAREAGIAYLKGRGISARVAHVAEEARVLGFAQGTRHCAPSLLFKGYDDVGRLRYIAKRLIAAPRTYDRGVKFDMAGSSKSFVPIFRGDPERVIITEGGVNFLSILELYIERMPTVIMTGGCGNIHFLESPSIQETLRGGSRFFILGERDYLKDGSINPHSARGWASIKKLVEDFTGENVPIVYPPEQAQDINDFLMMRVKKRQESSTEDNNEEPRGGTLKMGFGC